MNKPKIVLGETVVLVTWEDAWANREYWSLDSIDKSGPLIEKSVGYCIRNNKSGVTVAREFCGGGGVQEWRCVQHIPRAMIRNVQVLK